MTRGEFKELHVWQNSMKLCTLIYKATKLFPKNEIYGLSSQIKRAVVSIPSNIAEGNAKSSNKHFLNYLETASGSLYEVHTQIIIAERLGYISDIRNIEEEIKICGKLIGGLQKSIKNNSSNF